MRDINPTKSTGIDNLAGKVFKGEQILAKPITELINLSISLASFSDGCKAAKLNQIYKEKDKTNPENYRPIFLLPLISKVIEKIIHITKLKNSLTKIRFCISISPGFVLLN